MLNEKNKNKIIVIACIAVVLLLVWFILIEPYLTFKSREKEVLNAAKRYYEINTSQLPTGTRIATLTLKTLYEKELVDTSPNSAYATNKCNIENSFIKVRQENGEHQYYVYLECGLFKSDIDHEGPVIKLKGKDEITVERGDEYKELGVESVKDDTDGDMDAKKVVIDSSKVDTSKNGTYEVKYKISDSFNNQTIKIRTVKVVQTLNSIVKKEAGGNTYQGTHEDGYIKIDEILFKIVGINDDGSVKVVSNDALASINYEGIEDWLENYFYDKLSDSVKENIVKSKWCNEDVTNAESTTKCNKFTKKKAVSILSLSDYNKSKNSEGIEYLYDENPIWVLNKKDSKNGWIHMTGAPELGEQNNYQNADIGGIYGIKPALNIKKDSTVAAGEGTTANPYVLSGNEKNSKKGEKISTAKVGSYINFSGYDWRVIGKDSDDTTKIIMTSSIGAGDEVYYTTYDIKASSYNPNRQTNLGYKIVNDVTTLIKTSYFVNKEIEVPTYKDKISYGQKSNVKKYKVKLAATSLFDLFSNNTTSGATSWYRESLSNKTEAYIKPSLGPAEIYEYNEMDEYSIRVVGNLLKDVVIKEGNGTVESPYQLTK